MPRIRRAVNPTDNPATRSYWTQIRAQGDALGEAEVAASMLIGVAEPIGPAARSAIAAVRLVRQRARETRSILAARRVSPPEVQAASDALATAELAAAERLRALSRTLAASGHAGESKRFSMYAASAQNACAQARALRASVI